MLSKEYYRENNGRCRRMVVDRYGKMDEYPYDFKKALRCKLKGKHPHVGLRFLNKQIRKIYHRHARKVLGRNKSKILECFLIDRDNL